MSQQNPWSIKGIKAGNREAAKELAGRHGVTIGELINNLIEEAEGGNLISERVVRAANSATGHLQGQEDFYQTNFGQNKFGGNFGANYNPNNSDPNYPGPSNSNDAFDQSGQNKTNWNGSTMNNQNPQLADASRLAQAMENLNRNLANFGAANSSAQPFQDPANFNPPFGSNSQTDAFTHRAVESLLSRVEDNERKTDRTLSQLNLSLSDIKQAQETVADRLRRIEQSDPTDRALLALRNLESALARLANQVSDTETKTISLERKFEAEKAGRITPAEVEKILSQSTDQLFSKFDFKFGEFDTRLGGVEQLATSSIEQTDKGISLLSERIKDTEAHAQNTNESLREALLELSARLTAIESGPSLEAANHDLQAFASKFSQLEERINCLDENIVDLAKQTNLSSNSRFTELAASIGDRLLVSETETLKAIENVSGQLVNTVHNLDDRLKAVENLNSGSRDNATAMKLELGRITHAVNEQLEHLQKRESEFLDNAGKHINKLAEQVTARLEKLEGNSGDIIDRIGTEVKGVADTLLRKQTEASEDFARQLREADERLNQRLNEKFGSLTRDIHAVEDRTKAAAEPLIRNFDNILDRMDRLEAQNPASSIERIPSPDFVYGQINDHNSPLASPYSDAAMSNDLAEFGSDIPANKEVFENHGGFGSSTANFDSVAEIADFPADSMEIAANSVKKEFSSEFGKDFDDIANQSEFAPDFVKEEAGNDSLHGEFIDFEIVPPADEVNDPWLEQIDSSTKAPTEKGDYLSRARRAAIEAAEYKEEDKRKKKERKPIKKPAMAKNAKANDVLFDENGAPIENTKAKTARKSTLSPVAIAAAGALVLSSAALGYKYYSNSQQVDQNELPAALKDNHVPPPLVTQSPATIPESVPEAAVANPEMGQTNINAATTQSIPAQAAPIAPQTANASVPKVIPAAPIAKTVATPASPASNKNQFIGVNPAQGNLRPNTIKPAVAPVAPNSAATKAPAASSQVPRIASAATAPATPNVNARQSYEQAMQKLQAGDTSAALVLLTRASDGGDTKATNRLARMYERGEGVTRDLSKARRLTERAATLGSREAQHNLGVYYVDEGPGRDLTKAADSFKRAARRGLADSQYNLAAMAEQGNGIPKNEREAYFWYSVAGKNGDSDASKKASELAARLTPAQKTEEDRRISSFRPESGGAE